jgi:hypothetical protein
MLCHLQLQEVHRTLTVGALKQQQAQEVAANNLVSISAGRNLAASMFTLHIIALMFVYCT